MMIDTNSLKFQVLKTAICHAWSNVGYDMQDCCEASGEPLDNESAIEGCLDHITDVPGGKQADAILVSLIKEHKYAKVLLFLSKHIRLV